MKSEKPVQERRTSLRRYVAIGAIATLMLVALQFFVKHTNTGKEHHQWVFGKLQNALPPIDLDNPVVVLDISDLPGGAPGKPTPRNQLEEIIRALTELEQKPRAIAVDIDFSPRGTSYSAADDEAFFEFCLSVTSENKVPVFLAVAETKAAPPEAWLGSERYKELAVAAAADVQDTTHIPLWVKSSHSEEKLKMLNYALAREYRKQLPRASSWIEWLVETPGEETNEAVHHVTSIEDEATLTYENSVVNYSKLDQMRLVASRDVTADAIKHNAGRYSHKLVILGDLDSADRARVPGRPNDEPGSLVLASATYTLTKEPLYELKLWVRLAIDFLIAGAIILAVTAIRRHSSDPSWVGKQALFVYVAILIVFVTGWKLVTWAGILWLDFPLVALALFFHPKTEHLLDHLLEKLTQRFAPVAAKTACVVFSLIALSGQLSAQERLFLPAPCEKSVAAVGLRLSTPKPTRKRRKVGTCYVRDDRKAPWQPLTESSVKRQYRDRQHITCDADCSVTLYICGTGTQESVNKRLPDWFPIFHAYRAPPPPNDSNPNNLLRKAQLFVPADPQSSEERPEHARRLFGGINAIAGGISGRRAGVADRPTPPTSPANAGTDKGAKTSTAANRGDVSSATASTNDSSSATVLEQFLEALDKGNQARQKKDYPLAREHYLTAQKALPEDHRALQGLGNVFADEKNWSAAEQAYRQALKLQPRNGEVNLSLAFVLLQPMIANHDYAKALEVEELLLVASGSKPGDEDIYDLYEQLLELQPADLAQAEIVFRRAVMYRPNSVKANLRLARVLYRRDKPQEALEFVQRCEKYANGEALLTVARMYESQGRYKDAERVLKTALEQTPNNPAILYHLGSVMLQRKHYGSALVVLETAIKLDADAFAPALAYGIARFGKGDLAGAELSLDQASRKVGDNADGMQRLAYWFSALGDAYVAKRKFGDAIRVYEKSIIHTENPEVRDRLLEMKQERDATQKGDAKTPQRP